MNQEFKKVVEAIKFHYGINQSQIAERLEVDRTYVSNIISGKHAYSKALKSRIALEFPKAIQKDVDLDIPHDVDTPDMLAIIDRLTKQIEILVAQNRALTEELMKRK